MLQQEWAAVACCSCFSGTNGTNVLEAALAVADSELH